MIVLDTHVWVWWVSGAGRLSHVAAELIERGVTERSIHVSSISAWEVSLLVRSGRLELTMDPEDWIASSESLPFLQFVPVDSRIATRAATLPGPLHNDPADRTIIATAQILGAALVTRDERLWHYPHVETVW